jgi:hypothetical protein
MVGRIIGIAAGVLFIVGMFLPYLEFIVGMFLPYLDLSGPAQGRMTHTYWELLTRSDVIVFVVTIAAIDCLAIGLLVARARWQRLPLALEAVLEPGGEGLWVEAASLGRVDITRPGGRDGGVGLAGRRRAVAGDRAAAFRASAGPVRGSSSRR